MEVRERDGSIWPMGKLRHGELSRVTNSAWLTGTGPGTEERVEGVDALWGRGTLKMRCTGWVSTRETCKTPRDPAEYGCSGAS